MPNCLRKLRNTGLVAFLGFSLLLQPGCALLLLGVGGMGGYMIKKGEEGDAPKRKQTSEADKRLSTGNVGPEVELAA